MSDWFNLNEKRPTEDGSWLRVRKGDREVPWAVKYWESSAHPDGGYFVNAGFGREKEVTSWRYEE